VKGWMPVVQRVMRAVNKMTNMYVHAIARMIVRFEPVILQKAGTESIHWLSWASGAPTGAVFLCGNVLINLVCRASTFAKPRPTAHASMLAVAHTRECYHTQRSACRSKQYVRLC
jgi:hypothetical protein